MTIALKASKILFLSFVAIFASLYESHASFTENLKVEQLKNGLKIITIEDDRDPVITFQVWYRVGGINEIPGKTGLAHLTEHMMFKGSKKFAKGEVSRTVARHGGNENAFTGRDYTAYFQNFSKDKLEISLEVESDRMASLIIDPQEFLLERDVVMEERRQRVEDDPTSSVVEQMFAAAFNVHPYRNPVIGWMGDLENMAYEDLLNWYRTYYVPNNATIILAGDFDRSAAVKKIREYFKEIPAGPEPPPITISEPAQKGERRVMVKREAQLPFIFTGYKTPRIGHPDEFPLAVLENILSAGNSSRLYKSLVYDRQIAVYAGGSYEGLSRGPSLFYLYAGIKPGVKTEDVEEAIYAEMERIKKEGVTEKELQKAKNQVEASFIMGQDSIFYQAMMVGRLVSAEVDLSYLDSYVDNIRSVTSGEVRKVAETYFIEDKRTVGILVPEIKRVNNEQ